MGFFESSKLPMERCPCPGGILINDIVDVGSMGTPWEDRAPFFSICLCTGVGYELSLLSSQSSYPLAMVLKPRSAFKKQCCLFFMRQSLLYWKTQSCLDSSRQKTSDMKHYSSWTSYCQPSVDVSSEKVGLQSSGMNDFPFTGLAPGSSQDVCLSQVLPVSSISCQPLGGPSRPWLQSTFPPVCPRHLICPMG
jgi:hypothetical protein